MHYFTGTMLSQYYFAFITLRFFFCRSEESKIDWYSSIKFSACLGNLSFQILGSFFHLLKLNLTLGFKLSVSYLFFLIGLFFMLSFMLHLPAFYLKVVCITVLSSQTTHICTTRILLFLALHGELG